MGMESYVDIFLLSLSGAVILLFILVLVLTVRIGKLNKRYKKLIGNSNVENVDEVLISMQEALQKLGESDKSQADAIDGIRRVMKKMKSNVAVSRYNAFSQQGSDLSFSVAILDEEQDGFVLTGIHSREESYIYAKPVQKGQSSYALSPEEKEVIAQTSAGRKPVSLP
jgi:hypothetical protein